MTTTAAARVHQRNLRLRSARIPWSLPPSHPVSRFEPHARQLPLQIGHTGDDPHGGFAGDSSRVPKPMSSHAYGLELGNSVGHGVRARLDLTGYCQCCGFLMRGGIFGGHHRFGHPTDAAGERVAGIQPRFRRLQLLIDLFQGLQQRRHSLLAFASALFNRSAILDISPTRRRLLFQHLLHAIKLDVHKAEHSSAVPNTAAPTGSTRLLPTQTPTTPPIHRSRPRTANRRVPCPVKRRTMFIRSSKGARTGSR